MDNRAVKHVLEYLMSTDLDAKGKPISQNALAEKSGVPQPTIHRILKGHSEDPDTATLAAIAAYYKITVAELRGEEPIIRDPKIRRVVAAMEKMKEYQKDTVVKVSDSYVDPDQDDQGGEPSPA